MEWKLHDIEETFGLIKGGIEIEEYCETCGIVNTNDSRCPICRGKKLSMVKRNNDPACAAVDVDKFKVKPIQKQLPEKLQLDPIHNKYDFGNTQYEIAYAPPWNKKEAENGRNPIHISLAKGKIKVFNPPVEIALWNEKEKKMYIIDYSWIVYMRPEESKCLK